MEFATGFRVMARQCDQCLMSPNRIVPAARAAEIIKGTIERDCHFICHKASIAGEDVACRGHFDKTSGGRLARFCRAVGLIREVDPATLEPSTEDH